MRSVAFALGSLLVFASVSPGCKSDPQELSVDLRTDFVPVEEFIGVRTTVWGYDAGARTTRVASSDHTPSPSGAYRDGVRVAELRDVGNRRFEVEVTLVGRDGGALATRSVVVTVSGSYALTVLVTRDCRARECPSAGDPAYATACVAGRCADPRCGGEGAASCPPPECAFDLDCATPVAACARARCSEGACLAVAATPCGAGLWCNPEVGCEPSMGQPDAGTPDAGNGDGGGADAGAPDAGVEPSLVFSAGPLGDANPGFPAVLAATDTGFLVAYGRFGGGLAVAHTNASGDLISTDTLMATGAQEPLSLAVGAGGRVVLTWSESNTCHVAFVETGALVGDRAITTTSTVIDRALVAAGSDGFELLWHENDGSIRAQNLPTSAAPGPVVEVEPVAGGEVRAIASGPSGYLALYGNLDERHVRVLAAADGTPVAPPRTLTRLDASGGAGWHGAAAGRSGGFVVILTDLRPDGGMAGVAYALSADGTGGPPTSLGPNGAPAGGPWATVSATSGDPLALWWNRGMPLLQRFDSMGAPVGPPRTFTPAIGFTGLASRASGLGVLVQSSSIVEIAMIVGWP